MGATKLIDTRIGNYEGRSKKKGYAVAQLVEALRYKSEGRGLVSRWCH